MRPAAAGIGHRAKIENESLRGGRQANAAIPEYSEIASPAARNDKKGVIARSATTKQSQVHRMEKQYFVYIMTNKRNSVLYTGVTSDLKRRAFEHRSKMIEGFTKTYNIEKLVYYEMFAEPIQAIAWEKKIKAGSRQKKLNLILQKNPDWRDLYDEI